VQTTWLPFVSYNLWNLFEPAIGQEQWHCAMKRGFLKARSKEPGIASLIQQETVYQEIGLLAQKGIYEFHQDLYFLSRTDGVRQISRILGLERKSSEVRERVTQILRNYHADPILLNKEIIQLSRGDEGYPDPILVCSGTEQIKLFAAIDCIFVESDGTLHILDFKTGKSNFDYRQAYVYLLAARYLYRDRPVIASFYNLESQTWSKQITANKGQLQALEMNLIQIAQQHQEDLQGYRRKAASFEEIFPPHPGSQCRNCQFQSVCPFSIE
jgi:PD-(D/E)XK nuclease superfamily